MDDQDMHARLETLRRSLDLRVDSQGDWWDGQERFTHPGLISVLNRGLGLHPDTGEAVVRLRTQWCYIHCDTTPFVVFKLHMDGERIEATLNTGDRLAISEDCFFLRGETLFLHLEGVGLARLARSAQSGLAEYLIVAGDQYVIRRANREWPVRSIDEVGL